MTEFINAGPADASAHVVLAHGAGAAMTSPFLEKMTLLLTERGLQVSRFEFDYMAARRSGGKRRPPPRAELLMPEYRRAVEQLCARGADRQRQLIGGKSMGGRVASLIADELFAAGHIDGLICLGYPFHPPAKPENVRTAHLAALRCPALIIQGERDPLGARAEVEGYRLSDTIAIQWAGDGDHDLGPRGGSGFTRAANLALAADAIAAFAGSVGAPSQG